MGIIKPSDYDSINAAGEYNPLPAGAYICKIMKVAETKTNNGRDAIAISLDIAEGDHADYFMKSYRSDTRSPKTWGCVYVQTLTSDKTGGTNPFFKGFCTSVEQSNKGFQISWGEQFCECFKGKLVGMAFRREQYAKKAGGTAWSTKPTQFHTVDRVRAGEIKTPDDLPLAASAAASSVPYVSAPNAAGAYPPPPPIPTNEILSDDELPF